MPDDVYKLTREEELIRERIVRERGYWGSTHVSLLRLAPKWLDIYAKFVACPSTSNLLSNKERQLVYVAVDASVHHLYESGLVRHIKLAREAGATDTEIFEVLQLTCELAVLTFDIGMPILEEELERLGRSAELPRSGPTAELRHQQADFTRDAGVVPAWLDRMSQIAPDFAAAYMDMIGSPWSSGVLAPKLKALIMVALHASPATHNAATLREHMRRALTFGASGQEILDVMQLASAIVLHGLVLGGPAILGIPRN
jgi:alkylhydroperoxidase/carboxymuconolactone decarboxylase family protein YurZ